MVNSELLKNRISDKGLTQKSIAESLGMSPASLNQKLHNERKMSVEQMIEISELLEIEPKDYKSYFFVSY